MKTTAHPTTKANFPKLQVAINGNVFLMNSETSGTLLYSDMGNISGIGEYYPEINKSALTDFHGSITLEN